MPKIKKDIDKLILCHISQNPGCSQNNVARALIDACSDSLIRQRVAYLEHRGFIHIVPLRGRLALYLTQRGR